MIVALTFTPVAGGTPFDFMAAGRKVRTWNPKLTARGSARPRMGGHGSYPRPPIFSGYAIHHEGILVNQDAASLTDDRDTLLSNILGDTSADPDAVKLGTLTVKYAGWSETASADVILTDYELPMVYQPGITVEYMFQWECADPFFIGDSSSDKVLL